MVCCSLNQWQRELGKPPPPPHPLPLRTKAASADSIFDSNTHNTLDVTVQSHDPGISHSPGLFLTAAWRLSIDRLNQLHQIEVIRRVSASHGHGGCIPPPPEYFSFATHNDFLHQRSPSGARGQRQVTLGRKKGDILNWTLNRVQRGYTHTHTHTHVDAQWRSNCIT